MTTTILSAGQALTMMRTELLKIPVACQALGVSRYALTQAIRREQVRAVRLGRAWYIPAAEIERIKREGGK